MRFLVRPTRSDCFGACGVPNTEVWDVGVFHARCIHCPSVDRYADEVPIRRFRLCFAHGSHLFPKQSLLEGRLGLGVAVDGGPEYTPELLSKIGHVVPLAGQRYP